ncbi:uncharacterized protein [Diabrotica undecimpunctata]|uniref:uncharacterized protein n=1 Tax=Diabrotica undecimpunctata TaxID=50387 RepID=UPI003B631C09
MAALPKDRLSSRLPFEVTGVDYAGPLLIKSRTGRGCKISKAYICLFICAVTKAIHIELVCDLSKEYFLLALKRFVARRGMPSQVLIDNGSNFIAASNELCELGRFLSQNENEISESCHKDNINWKFNPPYGPHFGGLWEAGVKSIKHHLRRVTKGASFTFEQLTTLLTQVEAILNSRPLSPISDSPHNLTPLTPSHFLIGRAGSSVPEKNFVNTPYNRLTVFQHLSQLKQHLWNRWSKEYVSELQARTKWKQHYDSLRRGTLVLIKDDNLPPMKWKLGRIEDVIKGPDDVCRVAVIKTEQGLVRRAFPKICPLPLDKNLQTE